MQKLSPKSSRKIIQAPKSQGFFKTLWASLISPDFYASVGEKTFGQAAWYFARLALLYSVFIMLAVCIQMFTRFGYGFWGILEKEAVNLYPEELIITMENGKVSANMDEPIFIALPPSFEKEFKDVLKIEKLLVIDTKTPFTAKAFNEYDTLAWLTSDSLFVFKKDDKEIRGYTLSGIKTLEITKEKVGKAAEKVESMTKWLFPLMGLLMVGFIAIGLWIFGLAYALILAALVSLLRSVFKQDASYGKSYIIALYAMTWVYVIQIIFNGINQATGFKHFTFTVTLLTLVAVGWNLKKIPKKV